MSIRKRTDGPVPLSNGRFFFFNRFYLKMKKKGMKKKGRNLERNLKEEFIYNEGDFFQESGKSGGTAEYIIEGPIEGEKGSL